MDAPFPLAGEALATCSSLLWACGAVLFVRIPKAVSPGAMNLGKNVTGTLCFVLLMLLQEGRVWPRDAQVENVGWLVLGGVLGLALCDSLLFRAFREVGPRRTNVVMALSPVMVAFLAFFPPLEERPGLFAVLGMTVCLSGLLLAVTERREAGGPRALRGAGLRNALLAALLQAAGFVVTRLGMQDAAISVTAGALIRLVAGTGGLAVMGLAGGRLFAWIHELRDHGALGPVVRAALIGTFLGIWTNQAGVAWAEHVGVAATLNALAPVWLVPLSRAFLGERHDWRAWASAVLAVLGIALVSLG